MLISLKEMLEEAKINREAIGAFNIGNKDLLESIVECAEKLEQPTIIEASVPEIEFLGDDFFEYVKNRLESSKERFVLHLDHGHNLEQVIRAIQIGFNSVMIDGSSLNFEDNVKITKEVVQYAHLRNVSVEAELGTIGETNSSSCESGLDSQIIYTNPESVQVFCEETGVDALAIAIGTSHGMYPQGKTPKLRIDILKEIREKTNVNLVLHGGSGNSDDEIKKAIENGITKINISSEIKKAYFYAIKEHLEKYPSDIKTQSVEMYARKKAEEVILDKMKLFRLES